MPPRLATRLRLGLYSGLRLAPGGSKTRMLCRSLMLRGRWRSFDCEAEAESEGRRGERVTTAMSQGMVKPLQLPRGAGGATALLANCTSPIDQRRAVHIPDSSKESRHRSSAGANWQDCSKLRHPASA